MGKPSRRENGAPLPSPNGPVPDMGGELGVRLTAMAIGWGLSAGTAALGCLFPAAQGVTRVLSLGGLWAGNLCFLSLLPLTLMRPRCSMDETGRLTLVPHRFPLARGYAFAVNDEWVSCERAAAPVPIDLPRSGTIQIKEIWLLPSGRAALICQTGVMQPGAPQPG